MTVLVTGSSGHLGEALMRTLRATGRAALGLDIIPGLFTDAIGSIADRALVARSLQGVDAVLHVATLHKPHVATHAPEAFVETNIRGTLVLLEEAVRARVLAFVMTSTTSTFGDALKPPAGQPAAWIDERVAPVPKNIYGVTKTAAEDICQLFHRNEGLAAIVLRTSRFFPEEDDDPAARKAYRGRQCEGERISVSPRRDRGRRRRASPRDRAGAGNRLREIHRQRDDAVPAGRIAPACASDAPATLSLRAPGWEDEYARRGWRMFPSIDRVYDNALARQDLGWRPKWDFAAIVERLRETGDIRGPLARAGRRERLPCRAVRGRALSGDGGARLSEFAAWMRLDRPGRDAALLQAERRRLAASRRGRIRPRGGPAAVAYQVEVDARWETKRGVISGFLGDQTIAHEIRRDDARLASGWRRESKASSIWSTSTTASRRRPTCCSFRASR